MKKISSEWTTFYKRIFPTMWFGFLGLFFVIALASGAFGFLILPSIMAAFGYLLFKKLLGGLADEVLDGGDYLVVKNKGQQERIVLRDIMNVNYVSFQNPSRVTLTLRRASMFGDEVSFVPKLRFGSPFRKDPMVVDLIKRIDDARRGY